LADKLKEEFGADVELLEGSAGVFDVVADGELVFSKHAAGRFPQEQEIVDHLR